MLLALILIMNFSCPLSEENTVGVRFQSHTEYKIIVSRLNPKLKSKEVTFLFFLISLGKNTGTHLR